MRVKTFVLVCLAGAFLMSTYFLFSLRVSGNIYLKFLSVGQGDSILLETKNHGIVLVDTGRDAKVLTRLGEELNVFQRKIDVLIATHEDGDHIGGLEEVLTNFEVASLVVPFNENTNEEVKDILNLAKERNVKIIFADRPMNILSSDGTKIEILFPVRDMSQSPANDKSVVTKITQGENTFLLTGDLGSAGELFLVNMYGSKIRSNVLKLGHHGSDTSTNPTFLAKVAPELAIVSSGKDNSFGHPHRSVTELLSKFNIPYLNTADEGTISFVSNGKNIWVE